MKNIEKIFDKIFEQITRIFSSTLIILSFGGWVIYHTLTQKVYVNFISDVTFLVGLLLLRGQNVQTDRIEADIRRTKRDTKIDLEKSDEILKKLG